MSIWTMLFGGTKNSPQHVSSNNAVSANWSSKNISTKNNWLAATTDNDCSSIATTVYDPDGNPLQLGDRDEKASGGEGIVYTYAADPKFLIKVYKPETLNDQVKMREIRQRIQDMVRISAASERFRSLCRSTVGCDLERQKENGVECPNR